LFGDQLDLQTKISN